MDNKTIKVFKFTSHPDGYKCNHPGNNSGEYIGVVDYEDMESRAETAESSLAAMRQRAEEAESKAESLLDRVQGVRAIKDRVEAERDAAIARAERAEEAYKRVSDEVLKFANEAARLPVQHEDHGKGCCSYNWHRPIANRFLAILSSPPADASTMGRNHVGDTTEMVGERERRLANSLDEILNYSGGADNALEDEYVMERAHAALAEMGEKS